MEAAVYLWPHNYHIVISDVDGTITKSDVLGYVMPWVGSSWSHNGVAEFFTNIENNGKTFFFPSSWFIIDSWFTYNSL